MEVRSRSWDIGIEEKGEEITARWCKENGMKDKDVRLVAGGRMVRWTELAFLKEGNHRSSYGKSSEWNGEEEIQGEER